MVQYSLCISYRGSRIEGPPSVRCGTIRIVDRTELKDPRYDLRYADRIEGPASIRYGSDRKIENRIDDPDPRCKSLYVYSPLFWPGAPAVRYVPVIYGALVRTVPVPVAVLSLPVPYLLFSGVLQRMSVARKILYYYILPE